MKRRACLKWLGVASAMGTVPLTSQSWAMHHKRIERVGLQLYTIREAMAADASAALAAVAKIGYAEVETAGTGNLTAAEFARSLKGEGLIAPAAHIPVNLLSEQPDEVLTLAQTIGYRYIVVPWLPPEMRNIQGYTQTIDVLNEFGVSSAREGVQVAYHNHDFEFANIDGEPAFDLMLRNCDPNLVQFELDLYWAAHAGVNAKAYLQADPARFPLCHVKDRAANGDMVDVGDGQINFTELFAAGTGLEHYFVEHDRPGEPMASIKRSFAAVSTMRF